MVVDLDEAGKKLSQYITSQAAAYMPTPVLIEVWDGSMQFSAGYVWARRVGRTVQCIVLNGLDLSAATNEAPWTIWALPPNPDSPQSPYIALGVAANGADNSRLPRLRVEEITNSEGTNLGGTVTSVGLSLPGEFAISGSPVTSSGTLTGAWNAQTATHVLAGPTPSFRALAAADIPTLDHGTKLTGLPDDDHTQYLLLAGRSGGQTAYGGTDASDDLTLDSTSNATKGQVILAGGLAYFDENDQEVGIGIASPQGKLHVAGTEDNEVLIVRGYSSQTANLIEIQNSGASLLSYFDASGNLLIPYGSKSVPGLGFVGDTTTGLYHISSAHIGITNIGKLTAVFDTASVEFGEDATATYDLIVDPPTYSTQKMYGHWSGAAGSYQLVAYKSRGTRGSPAIVANNDRLGVFTFIGYDGTQYPTIGSAGLFVYVDGTPGVNSIPTRFEFEITQQGDTSRISGFLVGGSGTVFNDDADAAMDFRVEGDTDTHLLFVDASADKIGISEASPSELLHLTGGNLFVDTDSSQLIMGAGKDMAIYYDGTDGIIDTGLIAASDLVIDCGTEKTLELAEPVYNDIVIGLSGAKVPAANAPTWTAFTTNTACYTFDVGDYVDIDPNEMLHGWVEGTDIELHIHWASNGTDVDDRTVKWEIYYTWGDIGEAFSAEGTASAEETIDAATNVDKKHYYTDITTVTGTGFLIGSCGIMRIKRIASSGTEPSNDPYGMMVGVHYQVNTLGSRQEAIK